jgi:hypothetical protein
MTAMRLRFTIRDLLWRTLVAAMGLGWWADHYAYRKWVRDQTEHMVEEYKQLFPTRSYVPFQELQK